MRSQKYMTKYARRRDTEANPTRSDWRKLQPCAREGAQYREAVPHALNVDAWARHRLGSGLYVLVRSKKELPVL